MEEAEAAGRALAERHRRDEASSPSHDPDRSLLNYAESPRTGDWTLRSALVRLAQPEPGRVSATLELIRRCDAALHPSARALEQHVVDGDVRTAALARIAVAQPDDFPAFLTGYESVSALDADEHAALPLLLAAVELDALADILTSWSAAGFENPPVDELDRIGRLVFQRLADLDVPRESDRRGGRR